MTTRTTPTRRLADRIADAQPESTAAAAAVAAVDAALRVRPAVVDVEALVDRVVDAVSTPGGRAPDLAADLAAQRTAAADHEARTGVLNRAKLVLLGRLVDARAREADLGLDVLRAELAALLDDARPVLVVLVGVTGAADAIARDVVDEWRRAGDLAQRYAAVRAEQRTLVRHALAREDAVVGDVGSPSSVARLAPNPDRTVVDRLVVDHGIVADASELHDLAHHAVDRVPPPWATGDPLVDVRYVLRPGVRAWLPGVAELVAARDAYAARALDIDPVDTRNVTSYSAAQRRAYGRAGVGGVLA